MQGRVRLTVIDWPRGGQYVGDQRRHHVLTGFSQVPCIPDLLDAVLASIVGIEVVGRADESRRGGDVVVIAPGHPAVLVREIVLHPDLAQRIPSGQGAEVRRRLSTIHRVQHAASGPSDALGSLGAPHDGLACWVFSGISHRPIHTVWRMPRRAPLLTAAAARGCHAGRPLPYNQDGRRW
jgi:hypothetical protein